MKKYKTISSHILNVFNLECDELTKEGYEPFSKLIVIQDCPHVRYIQQWVKSSKPNEPSKL